MKKITIGPKHYFKNPRQITRQQYDDLQKWLDELGDLSGIVHEVQTDELVGGNMRSSVFDLSQCEVHIVEEYDVPDKQGTIALGYVIWRGHKYSYRQVVWDAEKIERANLIANKAGGDWNFEILANQFDEDVLLSSGFTEFDLGKFDLTKSPEEWDQTYDVPQDQPSPREYPIDMIFTATFAGSCCLAAAAGIKYGIQSGKKVCPNCGVMANHDLVFIDNDYIDYDHAKHFKWVSENRPKYATVRDAMTKEHCESAGVEYYPFEQILDWAYELNEYAENVIIIPKHDIIDKIPEQFMLGYSIPTSHGGTPLPPEAFAGRRVHLLGGSWKKQLAYLEAMRDDVVSLDNNYQSRISMWGSFSYSDGEVDKLNSIGIHVKANPAYIALAMSLGYIADKVNAIYREDTNEDTK